MPSKLPNLLGRPVDLVPRDGLKFGVRETVLAEAQMLCLAEEVIHGAAQSLPCLKPRGTLSLWNCKH